jgi:antibiotic biosynthesis monooxygenase (ABM) superfamily enzyme
MNTKSKIIQSIKIWAVIYPSITLFYVLFGSYLSEIPLYLRTLILTLILVPWIVFVGLPFIHLLLKNISNSDKS